MYWEPELKNIKYITKITEDNNAEALGLLQIGLRLSVDETSIALNSLLRHSL